MTEAQPNDNAVPRLRRMLANSGWLLAERLVGLISQLLIGGWVARYLGPQQFGTLNALLAISGLLVPIFGLGLSQVIVRDLLRNEAERGVLLGSGLLLRLAAIAVGLPLTLGVYLLLPVGGPPPALLAVALVGAAAQVLQEGAADLFRARLQAERIARATALAQLAVVLLRALLVVTAAPLIWFVWAFSLQFVIAAALTLLQLRGQLGTPLRWAAARARQLLRDSWPLLLAGLAALLPLKADQVLLSWLVVADELGRYVVAVRLTELSYLLPVAVNASLLPLLVRIARLPAAQQAPPLQLLFDLQLLLSLLVIPLLLLSAPLLITLLFGEAYLAALPYLWLYAPTFLFVAGGVLRGHWLTTINRNDLVMVTLAFGALLNLALNIWWIGWWGAYGAAAAALVTQLLMNGLSSRLLPDNGLIWRCQLRSLGAPLRLPAIVTELRRLRAEGLS
jgi:O-antigen/teichoic acid export membrane protein